MPPKSNLLIMLVTGTNMAIFEFEVGKTYQTRSVCDHDCIIEATIARRTDKTVWCHMQGEMKSFRIHKLMRDGEYVESFQPWGRYSMAPSIRATGVK